MKKFFSLVLLLALTFSTCLNVFAEIKAFEAEGVCIIGDDNTLLVQAKEFALQDAKRLALEQAGTYLSSATQVVNGQITKDEIISISSGAIYLDKIISEETRMENGVLAFAIKARFIIDIDNLQREIENYQKGGQKEYVSADKIYNTLLIENNLLKIQLAQATDPRIKEIISAKIKKATEQMAIYWVNKGNREYKQVSVVTVNGQRQFEKVTVNGKTDYKYVIDYPKALNSFNKAVAIDPNCIYAYIARAGIHADNGKYDLALTDYGKVLELQSQLQTMSKSQIAYVYAGRASVYYHQGQYDKALADVNKAMAYGSSFYNLRGWIYYKKGEYQLALTDFETALRESPFSEEAGNNRKMALAKLNIPYTKLKGTAY